MKDFPKDEKLLAERLKEYASQGYIPMHMPGHKRNGERFPWLKQLSLQHDITELDDFDDVVEAEVYPEVDSFISVNGSTGGILAAVGASVAPGEALLMARNCHKSVYHAAEICKARVSYMLPEWDARYDIFSRISYETIASFFGCDDKGAAGNIMSAVPECAGQGKAPFAAVVITSPTYEGDISDISRIAKLCHKFGAVLIVDEAHGAHFGMEGFPESAIKQGADIVIQSLHKTLPSPTQTAVVHIKSSLVSAAELRRRLLMFQTSSPSFLLMAAAQKAIEYTRQNGRAEAAEWLERIEMIKNTERKLEHITVRDTDDPSKLFISCLSDGEQWRRRLRKLYGIEAEMAMESGVLLMTGMGDTKEAMRFICEVLMKEDKSAELAGEAAKERIYPRPSLPGKQMDAWRAVRLPKVKIPIKDAAGLISADYMWRFPPGIPYLVPGEIIDDETADKAAMDGTEEINVIKTDGMK